MSSLKPAARVGSATESSRSPSPASRVRERSRAFAGQAKPHALEHRTVLLTLALALPAAVALTNAGWVALLAVAAVAVELAERRVPLRRGWQLPRFLTSTTLGCFAAVACATTGNLVFGFVAVVGVFAAAVAYMQWRRADVAHQPRPSAIAEPVIDRAVAADGEDAPVAAEAASGQPQPAESPAPESGVSSNVTVVHFEPETIEEVFADLRENYVGLSSIESHLRALIEHAKIEERRRKAGLKHEPVVLHTAFTGPPGTGKTETAQIMARALAAEGLLSSGHFVKATRANLVGDYQGQTTTKINDAIKKALGGLLMLDEAYGLVEGDSDDFGKQALNLLVELMEENRDDLCVVFAGYEADIDRLISVNAGLGSRISTRIRFPGYSVEEHKQIIRLFIERGDRELTPLADQRLSEIVEDLVPEAGTRSTDWGNARDMRRLYESIKLAQSSRLYASGSDELETIELEDVEAGYARYLEVRATPVRRTSLAA